MAFTTINFEQPQTGAIKSAPVGFSWTVFFFGFFVPLFRGDFKWAIIILLAHMLTMGLSGLIFMFIYNKLYIKDLIGSGYKARSIASGNLEYAEGKLGLNIPRVDPK